MSVDLELCYAGVDELVARLRSRSVSAVELVRNALARLEETDGMLNAFSHVDTDGAMGAAHECDARLAQGIDVPPFCGIPVSVKDLIEVRGMPCRYGSRMMADYVAPEDAPSVARLRAAGAVILGMTTTSEFGFRGYTENPIDGVTRNPWDTARTPGGSSGGAASSVAAGVTPFALGTDAGGSIRNPASFTGLVGIKAQFGRVPIYPPSAALTLAHVGPLARNVADAIGLLRVIAGPNPRDWTSLQPPIDVAPGLSPSGPLRIVFSPTLGYGKLDPEVRAVVCTAVARLDGVAGLIELEESVCEDESELFQAEFIGGISARLGTRVAEQPQDIDPLLLAQVLTFRERSAASYTALLRRRAAFRDHMRRFFDRCDLLLCPMTPCPAWPIGERVPPGFESTRMWSFFGFPFNLTGQPAASLPCGVTASGLPVGLQLVVKPQQENLLFELLAAFDRVLGCSGKRPVLT
jgi:aspartyl-tRNA(Asn)/glutamyl-tRNA(Gln) amidotransferase subunit A